LAQARKLEDAFRVLRAAETRKGGWSKRVALERQWSELVDSGLINKEHRFKNLDFENFIPPRGFKGTPLKAMFTPAASKSPAFLRVVMGPTRQPKWPTSTPLGELQQHLDVVWAHHCATTGDWLQVESAFLSVLARSTTLLVTHASFGGRAYFSLGDFGCSVVLGWPAKEVRLGEEVFWQPESKAQQSEIKYMLICELDGWTSWSYRWLSPASLRCIGGGAAEQHGLLVQQTSPPAPLLKTAASACFWQLSKTVLLKLARHLGVEVHSPKQTCTPLKLFVLECMGFVLLFSLDSSRCGCAVAGRGVTFSFCF
jgi:hypothetical protein